MIMIMITLHSPPPQRYFYDVSLPESYASTQNESALNSASVDAHGELVVTGDRDDVKFYDAHTGMFLARRSLGREVSLLKFYQISFPSFRIFYYYWQMFCYGKHNPL